MLTPEETKTLTQYRNQNYNAFKDAMKTQGAHVTLTGHPVCTQTCGVTRPFDVMCRNSQCRNDLILDSSKLRTQNRTPHRFLRPLV